MIRGEERDLREALLYDGAVKGVDTGFWAMDSAAGLTRDTVRSAIKVGDTGATPASASSYSQYLYGDYEFAWIFDSTVPDSSDSELYFGLRNIGDTLNRGAIYFDLGYDTTAGDSSTATRPFAIRAVDEFGNARRQQITWDTDWSGNGTTRFRFIWETDGIEFYVNDTIVGRISAGDTNGNGQFYPNTNIPQALRISRRSAMTVDTSPPALKYVNIRNARKVI